MGSLSHRVRRLPDGYLQAMEDGGVRADAIDALRRACARVDDPIALSEAAERLQALVRKAEVPSGMAENVVAAYPPARPRPARCRCGRRRPPRTAGTSFAGMHETYANVIGESAVLERLVDCWASLYDERVIGYQATKVRRPNR